MRGGRFRVDTHEKYRAGIDIEVRAGDQMRDFDPNDDRPLGAGPA